MIIESNSYCISTAVKFKNLSINALHVLGLKYSYITLASGLDSNDSTDTSNSTGVNSPLYIDMGVSVLEHDTIAATGKIVNDNVPIPNISSMVMYISK